MKYCENCGNELADSAVFCPKCGNPSKAIVTNANDREKKIRDHNNSVLVEITKVLLIIGTVSIGLATCCFGLIWAIPMTVNYFNRIKRGEEISVAFKVCVILFVSMVAGILMFVDNFNVNE